MDVVKVATVMVAKDFGIDLYYDTIDINGMRMTSSTAREHVMKLKMIQRPAGSLKYVVPGLR
jgi:hypothetical protein